MADSDQYEDQSVALRRPQCIVAVGGSAGSLKPFETLLDTIGHDAGLCVVIVAHRGPGHDELLSDLLTRHTRMPVIQISGPTVACADHVYIAPPDTHLEITDGELLLCDNNDTTGERTLIDRFFRSVAADLGSAAIGIIMSGSGRDGTRGARAIHEAGGLVIAQLPGEAEFASMPEHVIASGHVGHVLKVQAMPEAMAAHLERDTDRAHVGSRSDTCYASDQDTATYDPILKLIKSRHDRDFSHYKPGTIGRRIRRRMGIRQSPTTAAYLELLEKDSEESDVLLGDLRIGVTGFFRDPDIFETLEQSVIPEILAAEHDTHAPVRVWVPGCATGEEAYSLAISFSEAVEAHGVQRDIQVFATDIDESALSKGRGGCYSAHIADQISEQRLARWFEPTSDGYRVNNALRSRVLFAAQSVIADPPFSRLDMVSCRNLLIYLDRTMQRHVIGLFHFALKPQRWLLLGSSENIDNTSALFERIADSAHIYRARRNAAASHYQVEWTRSSPRIESRDPTRAVTSRGEERLSNLVPSLLTDIFVPPSVVTNGQFDALYLHGELEDFLSFPNGPHSSNLLGLARQGLQGRLRSIVLEALKDTSDVVTARAQVLRNGRYQFVLLKARQVRLGAHRPPAVLVNFLHAESTQQTAMHVVADIEQTALNQSAELDYELEMARAEIARMSDELEASQQEFETTHEEALSTNEELQSSNEELESSKEELQSLNEELTTVNSELQEKMQLLRDATDDIANLLDSTDIATLFLDEHGNIKRFTPATRRLFNLIDSDVGRPVSDISHVFMASADILEDIRRVHQARESIETEEQTRDNRWFLRRVMPYRTVEGGIRGVVLSFLDVTKLKQAERQSAASNDRFRLIYHDNPAMYFIVDSAGLVSSVNDFGASQLGYQADDIIGRSFAAMHSRPEKLRNRLQRCHYHPGSVHRWELQLRRRDDTVLWVRANARRTADVHDNLSAVVLVSCEDISLEKKLGEEARFHSTHDSLTGLLNRREFERLLGRAMKTAQAEDRQHVLAYLDLDKFKIINDTYGHQAGDELLRQITRRMRETLQQRDLLGRIGGDEFALLMEDRSIEQARAIAQQLVAAIKNSDFLWERFHLKVGACVGLAVVNADAGNVSDVTRAADAACFAAKDLGSSSVYAYSDEDNQVSQQRNDMNWADQLRTALADDRIEMAAQPIVCLDDIDGPRGHESLLRLRLRDGTLIAAEQFIDAANRYGLIRDLDRRALHKTLACLQQPEQRLTPLLWVAVNVSATSLIHPEFLEHTLAALDHYDVAPDQLCFEITETSVISNLTQAQQVMQALQSRGCRFALDDFGTGLSSFNYLRELPVEYVKIDGSFVRGMLTNPSDYAMVKAIADISRLMGKTVIAEGVETEDLAEAVQGLGVKYAQGHRYAHPEPIDIVLGRRTG
ncbi:MAG: EAL domain-containing protein [Salinisphaera sp.]|jgi:two-component system CheB/CheR fusion protein|nr:EAL domain-containing protein [Salinisphaera sp.]